MLHQLECRWGQKRFERRRRKVKRLEYNDFITVVFDRPADAETAVKDLRHARFEQISIVAKDDYVDEQASGYRATAHPLRYWGNLGAFWGGVWGLLFGSAFFIIPGIGRVVVGGQLITPIVAALETCFPAGLSPLGAGLCTLGLPVDRIPACEAVIRCGKLLLVAHGTTAEVERAREVLGTTASRHEQIVVV